MTLRFFRQLRHAVVVVARGDRFDLTNRFVDRMGEYNPMTIRRVPMASASGTDQADEITQVGVGMFYRHVAVRENFSLDQPAIFDYVMRHVWMLVLFIELQHALNAISEL